MDLNDKKLRIAVEGRHDALIVQALISKLIPDVDPYISVAGRSLMPRYGRGQSYFGNLAPQTIVIYDLEEGMIPDELPQREESSDLVFIPAVPTLEAWLLSDPEWAAKELKLKKGEIMQSFKSGKTSLALIKMRERVRRQFERNPSQLERSISEDFNIGVAESTSPSFGKFVEVIKKYSKKSSVQSRPREIAIRLENAIFASLVAELQPVTKIVYKTADGSLHTAGDIRNAILEGNELGISYMESILRLARNFLAFEANDDDDQLGDIDD